MILHAVILYFSISGNTRKIAEAIHGAFVFEGCNSSLISVTEYDNQADRKLVMEADIVGFGVPCHFFRAPSNIPSFILNNLPDISGKPVFLFCTYGGIPAKTMNEMVDCFHKKGAKIVGGAFFPGFSKFPWMAPFKIAFGKPDQDDINAAKKIARYLLFKLQNPKIAENWDISFKIKNRNMSESVISRFFSKNIINFITTPMIFNSKCNKCGICTEICPVNCIKLNPQPGFSGHCLKCYECYYVCPQKAIEIQYNWFHQLLGYLLSDLDLSFRLERKEFKQPHFYL